MTEIGCQSDRSDNQPVSRPDWPDLTEMKTQFIPPPPPLPLTGSKLSSLLASGSFNQVQPESWQTGGQAERESSGFSRQADRSDNTSQKNRDLFAAHSIQPTDFDFQILSLYLPAPIRSQISFFVKYFLSRKITPRLLLCPAGKVMNFLS